jgi:hypothetical protein
MKICLSDFLIVDKTDIHDKLLKKEGDNKK